MTDQKPPIQSTAQHWPATVVMCVGLVAVVTVYALSSPDQRSQMLAGIAVLWGTVQAFMPAIRKAAGVSSALVLALALGALVQGCDGGSVSVPTVIGVGEVVIDGTCVGAEKLCEALDAPCHSGACHVFHSVCPTLAPAAPVQVSCDQPVPAS